MFSFLNKKSVFLDYASATPVCNQAKTAMDASQHMFANPGSIHADGVAVKKVLQTAREEIAHELGAKARTIIFTSGATEANNLAILGLFKNMVLGGRAPEDTHWVTSIIEHPSVLACFAHIEQMGGVVTRLKPDERGIITPESVMSSLTKNTVLVSLGWANGEIGTVVSLRKISRDIKKTADVLCTTILFHSDAGQAPLYISPHAHDLGLDMLTLDSAKLYGPRGVGVLFLSDRVQLSPIILGGGQERTLRAGTENVPAIIGFAKAFSHIGHMRNSEKLRMQELKQFFVQEIQDKCPSVVINGTVSMSLPHIVNVSVPGEKSGEYMALTLDHAGVSVSTKSACREGEGTMSHVVSALGGEIWRAKNTLRISFGMGTTKKDITRFIQELRKLA